MRASIWLYILEQSGVSCCLLLCIGWSAGLKRVSAWRMMAVSLAVALLSAALTGAWSMLRALALLMCAGVGPILAWPGAPKRIWGRMIAGGCFMMLGAAGLLRLMHGFALPGLLAVACVCAALMAAPIIMPKPAETPRLATVDIRHGPHHLTLTALIDSGNLLRDGVTGLPVIVISHRAAQRLIQLPTAGKVCYPFRLLTVRTVNGTGMMTIFHPDSVCLLLPGGWVRVETLLGVSPEGYEGFQALVPASLMQGSLAMTI